MLSLSTAFHIKTFPKWQALLAETRRLGFGMLEMNVEAPESMLRETLLSVEKNEIKISSLHNYCPRLENLPRGRTIFSGYIINSDDADERKLALDNTRRTIEWAGRLGAKAVVMHMGEVNTGAAGMELAKYVRGFGRKGMLYERYWEAFQKARGEKSQVYLEMLMRALDVLLPLAADNNLKLGLENRFHFHEMPDIEELLILLDKYAGAPMGYWHDTGHAEMFVRQGWAKEHAEYLKAFDGRTVGMHLHDLRGLSDHFAPGSGDLDFGIFREFSQKAEIKVVEAHSKSTSAEVQKCAAYLEKCGIS